MIVKKNIDNRKDNNNQNNNNQNDKNSNYDKIFEEQYKNNKNNNENLPKCLQCNKSYHHKDNVFGLCNDCLLKEINSQILTNYIFFLQGGKKREEDFHSFIQQQKCSISVHKDIPLSQAIFNSGYKLDDLFIKLRKQICLYCGFNINNDNYYLDLPCECRICSKNCFDGYLKMVEKQLEIKYDKETNDRGFNVLRCPCGFRYDLQAFIFMINKMEEKHLKDHQNSYREMIKKYFKWKCMICRKNFNNNVQNFCIIFKDENLDKKILKNIDFHHYICIPCGQNYGIKNDIRINCQFCHSNHLITDIKALSKDNEIESDCIII